MSEKHHEKIEFFICPNGDGAATEHWSGRFPMSKSAIAALREQAVELDQFDPSGHQRSLELIAVERPGKRSRPSRTPRHQFFVDIHAGEEGDGSLGNPWPDFASALEHLQRLDGEQEFHLSPRQSLSISYHEIFTPTDLERWKKIKENIAKYVFLAMALLCVAPVVMILAYLTYKAWPALTIEFLTSNPKNNFTEGGIWAPLIGTFFLVLLSLLLAAPVGVLAGVYMNEYAPNNWFTRIVNLAVVNLAGVPSIVIALFGVGAFVLFMNMGRSLLAASCTVAVMTLPVIITSTREALAAVPMSFREACWNMGASKWQTIRTIVLPNSIAGILTGVILQVSRAAGETAPILFTGAILYVKVADSGWDYFVPYGADSRFMALSLPPVCVIDPDQRCK